jgi:hypothetical protein
VIARRPQWGRALLGAEEDIDLGNILEAFDLQWGRALSGAEE